MIGIDHEYIPEGSPMGATLPPARPNVHTTYCEVMQMGACKLDAQGREIDVLNRTVKAHRIPEVPLWLTNMTGMTTQRREAEGVTFPEALAELVDFVGNDTGPWVFNGDWWVLWGNAKAHNISMPFTQPFLRVARQLPDFGIILADYQALGFDEVNSGNLHKVLGIKLPEITGVGAHDAAHDARSIAYSMYHLLHRH